MELSRASSEKERFYALRHAAKESFIKGSAEEAGQYAIELLALAPKYRHNWNYGNAIHDGNLVLGRVAVLEGKTEDAKQYLLEAGKSPGSPQINSFGPNMNLAKDLLEKGERQTVVAYFDLCRRFWRHTDKLDRWTEEIKNGKVPNFGANLVY